MGAVHDFGSLIVSMRNQGKSISETTGKFIGPKTKTILIDQIHEDWLNENAINLSKWVRNKIDKEIEKNNNDQKEKIRGC